MQAISLTGAHRILLHTAAHKKTRAFVREEPMVPSILTLWKMVEAVRSTELLAWFHCWSWQARNLSRQKNLRQRLTDFKSLSHMAVPLIFCDSVHSWLDRWLMVDCAERSKTWKKRKRAWRANVDSALQKWLRLAQLIGRQDKKEEEATFGVTSNVSSHHIMSVSALVSIL